MELIINVKQAGRKHALFEKQVIEIDDIGKQPTLKELINAVVKQQVITYNSKPSEKNLIPFLTDKQMAAQASGGKIGFGSIYNEQKADVVKAQGTALQAFEDGIYAVFANDEELTSLSRQLDLSHETVITFIRLTFLAGSYW
ncbi:hypothetical protein [Chitinophaga ginsengisoli]|uniref:Uncharacterized protein n=1 Tax=Chitinophaga ginsengisoli TaxID=363837 RepID=A0A2P8FX56_9BACT|nr:hypothetical protein [Chitinophaga ginsengisoli]PSL26302.1 hypothetical protein CLV42_11113 [Chitinophaga ginsengisoli]